MERNGKIDMQAGLTEVVEKAWRSFEEAAEYDSRVNPAIPILFFGDLDSYLESSLRVVTVGLNPSLEEFPADNPFQRFPAAEWIAAGEQNRYLKALSAYFREDPYSRWFSSFEPLLNGLGASYYAGTASTALHTDICSPVATNPTWTGLNDDERKSLEADGGPLWHELLEVLRPQLVVLSVARHHLERIRFPARGNWGNIYVFERKVNGDARRRPYKVMARSYMVGSDQAQFVFCPAGLVPLMEIGTIQKRELGEIILGELANGR